MFKRNLLKRSLPILLSVAMTFQSVPITAMAAENPPAVMSEEATESEPAAEAKSESAAEETAEPAAEKETSAESTEAASDGEEQVTEDEAGEESAPAEDKEVTDAPETEVKDQENSGSETETESKTETGTETEIKEESETSTETETETETEAGELEANEAAASKATKIIVNDDSSFSGNRLNVGDNSNYYYWDYYFESEDTHVYTMGYKSYRYPYSAGLNEFVDPFDAVKDLVISKTEIKVGDGTNNTAELKNTYLTAEWIAIDAEGKEKPSEKPENVGSYALHLEIKAQAGLCEDASCNVYFNITPKEVDFGLGDMAVAAPGSKIADFKEKVTEEIKEVIKEKILVNGENLSGYDESLIKGVTVKVYKDGNTEAEATDTFFSKNADYTVAVVVELDASISGNYELVGCDGKEYVIRFGDDENPAKLRKTMVEITPTADFKQEIVKTYDPAGQGLAAADIQKECVKDFEVKVEDPDEADTYISLGKEFAEAESKYVTAKWYTKEINRIDDDNQGIDDFPTPDEATQFLKEFKNEDGDVVEQDLYTVVTDEKIKKVGEYYLVLVYDNSSDEKQSGTFAKGYSDPIKVTIEPIDVVLVPTGTIELNNSMDEAAVAEALAKVEWKLAYAEGGTKTGDVSDAAEKISGGIPEEKSFFGVLLDKSTTLYYSPVFKLARKESHEEPDPKDATKVIPTELAWELKADGTLRYFDRIEAAPDKTTYAYYVVFTGEKAVYSSNGTIVTSTIEDITNTSTNSANQNYRVKVDEKSFCDNALKIENFLAGETSIDTSKIVAEGEGLIEKPVRVVYNPDKALFDNRDEYKQAVVANDADAELTYTWHRFNPYTIENEEESEYISEKDYYEFLRMAPPAEGSEAYGDWSAKKAALEAGFSNAEYTGMYPDYCAPQEAGLYRLKVAYKGKFASTVKYVYFLIEKQELMFVPDKQYGERDTNKYTTNGYTLYKIPENDVTKGTEPLDNWDAEEAGVMQWQILEQKKDPNGDNIPDAWKNWDGVFKNNPENQYEYKVAITLSGASKVVMGKDGNPILSPKNNFLNWKNYTAYNLDEWWDAYYGEEGNFGLWKNGLADIIFGASEIEFTVTDALPKGKEYDGTAVAAELTGVTLSGAAAEAGLKLNASEDDANNVRVEWYWEAGNKVVPTKDVIYGGTYWLVASFKGLDEKIKGTDNDTYDGNEELPEGLPKEWLPITDEDGNPYKIVIDPLKVEITPAFKDEAVAGQWLDEMVDDTHVEYRVVSETQKDLPENDKKLFERGGTGIIVPNAITGIPQPNAGGGYPILAIGDDYSGEKVPGGYFLYDFNGAGGPIRYGSKYNVKIDDECYELFAQYAFSYDLICKSASSTTKFSRGDADVEGVSFIKTNKYNDEDGYVRVNTVKTEKDTYETKAQEGIPFVYSHYKDEGWLMNGGKDVNGQDIPLDKNYIAVNIIAPAEFNVESQDFVDKNFVYENEIRKAKGYVIVGARRNGSDDGGDGEYDGPEGRNIQEVEGDYYITALFPVEYDAEGKIKDAEKKFSVTWEPGYTSNFVLNLEGATLQANLKEAVAPKSIAFNGVKTKMVVGEQQQLDVKITKKQLGDVIKIRYRIAGTEEDTSNDYVSVDPETGRITALSTQDNKKPAKVSIEAYAVHLATDGKKYEPITEKGVKPAKANITIAEVTAPKIKKVIAEDVRAEVQYTAVTDGYRREIYVKKADTPQDKKIKATELDEIIDKMPNGQWKDDFAIAPIYVYYDRAYYDNTLKAYRRILSQLDADQDYVVYVRNVSAERTLADGSKVKKSVAGSVKAFKTTKSMVRDLEPYFNLYDTKNKVEYSALDGYTVKLADKSAQLQVYGWFKNLSEAAEDGDEIQYMLPLKSDPRYTEAKLKDNYMEPKLSYYVTDAEDHPLIVSSGVGSDGKPRYSVSSDAFDNKGKQKYPSKYAAITNKGKITLKGVDLDGRAMVQLAVIADNGVFGFCDLTIIARPDSFTKKNVKPMKVGDSFRLADYLEYKENGKKVPNYWSSYLTIDSKYWQNAEENGFKLSREYDGIHVTAVKPGNYTLPVTDQVWSGEGRTPVTQDITFKVSALDPVKGLKTVYTDDKHITVNFAHAGNPDAFDIEVKDARNNVIYKKLVDRDQIHNGYNENDGDYVYYREPNFISVEESDSAPWLLNEQKGIVNGYLGGKAKSVPNCLKYFEKTKTYAYTIYTERLLRLSSYTVSVVPVYNDSDVKVITTKAKTTNIPASYRNLDIEDPNYNNPGEYFVREDGYVTNEYEGIVGDVNTYLISGNTYTVQFDPGNPLAMTRGTDTLTWKSSNTKVVSVKANQGSYSATLKAMQQGKSVITVTSKVTKKTIARYHVAVKAVGNANNYGGEFEWSDGVHTPFYDNLINTVDPYYEGEVKVLTVSNPVVVRAEEFLGSQWMNTWEEWTSRDRIWIQFTAPVFGEYKFSNDADLYYERDRKPSGYEAGSSLRLEKGQKIYFKVDLRWYLTAGYDDYDYYEMSVSEYTDLSKMPTLTVDDEKPLQIGANEWVSFTAPESNRYIFDGLADGAKYEKDNISNTIYDPEDFAIDMEAGETIFIKNGYRGSEISVTKRDTTITSGEQSIEFTKDEGGNVAAKSLRFTASISGDYVFEYDDKIISVEYLNVDLDPIAGDAVLAPRTAATFAVEGTTEEKPAPELKKETLFIEAGATVVLCVSLVDSEELGDTLKTTITISEPRSTGLGNGQTAGAGKTETYEYTILDSVDSKTATRYTITVSDVAEQVDNSADIKWYAEGTGLISPEYNYNETTGFPWQNELQFVVENGEVIWDNVDYSNSKLKVGDKVYVRVKGGTDDEGKDIAAKVDVKTEIVNNDLNTKGSLSVALKNDFEEWAAYTVDKDGDYEITATLVDSATHNMQVYSKELNSDESDNNPFNNYGYSSLLYASKTKSKIVSLTKGKYTFRISTNGVVPAESDKEETATLTIKRVDATKTATAITEEGVPVSLAKQGDVAYYSFKVPGNAAANDIYTLTWTPDEGCGEAEVSYSVDGLDDDSFTDLGTLNAEWSYDSFASNKTKTHYFKVEQTDTTKKVTGKLKVSVEKASDKVILIGEAQTKPIKIDANQSTVNYKFIIPDNTDLGYIVTVKNNSKAGTPELTVDLNDEYTMSVSTETKSQSEEINDWNSAYESKYIRITTASVLASGATAEGTITITAVEADKLPTGKIAVAKGDSKWYTYSVEADDRYLVEKTADKAEDAGKVDVTWIPKSDFDDYWSAPYYDNPIYLKKGVEYYVHVEGTGEIATKEPVNVTLAPTKLVATDLGAFTNGKIEVKDIKATAEKPAYYTFKAPKYAKYEVTFAKGEEPSPMSAERYVPGEDWDNGEKLEMNDVILIKVSGEGTLTVTQTEFKELKVGTSTSATLEAGDTTTFTFRPYVAGYYDFRITDGAADLAMNSSGNGNWIYRGENYYVFNVSDSAIRNKKRYEFTVRNNGKEKATFTMTAGTLKAPVTLDELDKEFSVPVEKGRVSLINFVVPENYRYAFICSKGSKVNVNNAIVNSNDNDPYPFCSIEDGNEGTIENMILEYSGDAAGTATVKVVKAEPDTIGAEKTLSMEVGEVQWYAYKADADAEYEFNLDGAWLTLYEDMGSKFNLDWVESKVSCEMSKDDVIYIRVRNTSGNKIENGKLTVTKKEAVE